MRSRSHAITVDKVIPRGECWQLISPHATDSLSERAHDPEQQNEVQEHAEDGDDPADPVVDELEQSVDMLAEQGRRGLAIPAEDAVAREEVGGVQLGRQGGTSLGRALGAAGGPDPSRGRRDSAIIALPIHPGPTGDDPS